MDERLGRNTGWETIPGEILFFFPAWGYETQRCGLPRRYLFSRVIYWAVSCSHMRRFEVCPRWTCVFCLITLFLPIHSFAFVSNNASFGVVPIYVFAGFDLPTHGNNRWIYHQEALILLESGTNFVDLMAVYVGRVAWSV